MRLAFLRLVRVAPRESRPGLLHSAGAIGIRDCAAGSSYSAGRVRESRTSLPSGQSVSNAPPYGCLPAYLWHPFGRHERSGLDVFQSGPRQSIDQLNLGRYWDRLLLVLQTISWSNLDNANVVSAARRGSSKCSSMTWMAGSEACRSQAHELGGHGEDVSSSCSWESAGNTRRGALASCGCGESCGDVDRGGMRACARANVKLAHPHHSNIAGSTTGGALSPRILFSQNMNICTFTR
jgi:hypothetical protein